MPQVSAALGLLLVACLCDLGPCDEFCQPHIIPAPAPCAGTQLISSDLNKISLHELVLDPQPHLHLLGQVPSPEIPTARSQP